MKFPHLPVHNNEDITRNFEALEAQGIYSGSGEPAFPANVGDYYFRRDDVTTSGHRIYVCDGGTTWTGLV